MTEQPVHVLVRYTSGHRAKLSRGWKRYGDRTPLTPEVAMLIAACLRARGAEVQIKPTT